jgi:transcriptional regulator with XRE-family HTH domain
MIIAGRIRLIRERKQLSQVDLAIRTHLLRGYLAQIENGEVVPEVETLDKIAAALDVPIHKLFYDGDEAPALPNLPDRRTATDIVGNQSSEARK